MRTIILLILTYPQRGRFCLVACDACGRSNADSQQHHPAMLGRSALRNPITIAFYCFSGTVVGLPISAIPTTNTFAGSVLLALRDTA
jgi:hypothetical protein